MIQITKDVGRIARPQVGTTDHRHRVTPWLLRMAMMIAILIFPTIGYAQTLKYLGSVPENNGEIKSFENITLKFDLSDVVSIYGGTTEEWGVCCNAYYDEEEPEEEMSAVLYLGIPEEGTVLGRLDTTIKPGKPGFLSGGDFLISFPNIEVEPGQKYTLVVTYDMYACQIDKTTWERSTKYSFFNNPLTLTFYGAKETEKVLVVESNSIDDNLTYEQMPELKVSFNYAVAVNDDMSVGVYEGSGEVVTSSSIFVDSEDANSIVIKFPETALYYGHNYNIVIPTGTVNVEGEKDNVNQDIEISIKGASYRYFGLGRGLNPSDGSVTILDEIVVPLNLPESETIAYGFSDTEDLAIMHIYAGNTTEGEEVLSVNAEAATDGNSLIFRPNYAFDPSTDYTLVIPEGDVKLYDLSSRNPSHQKEFVSDRIELHYSTPSVEDLPKWNPTPMNVKNDEEISELKYFILDCPEYEYDETKFDIVFNKNYEGKRKDAALYKVTDTGEEELVVFNVTLKTLDANSEIGNGELEGRYFVGEVNETLYEGTQYKLVWFANKFIVNNPFIGKYIGNPEISVSLKGATPTADDFGLKANIDDRLHSHADVFSFITESEVKAGVGATMKLMDGEENVAEAPVYVSREANGHRVYADFGGKKLESGKSYDVVLPEGSVYATNGIVSNPEIKSALTAMPETPAAPEFISIALNIDEYASATYRMVKGQESVLDLKAGEDWKLESLKLNGEDVTADVAENGLYTLPALDEDANLDATYAYAHAIDYDYETGVGSIEDLPYSLSKDGSHVIISGLNGGERIAIYTMGGMKIASPDTVPADMHQASIALPEGQIYIIMINNTSIKWKH